jgi:hypothetical protein
LWFCDDVTKTKEDKVYIAAPSVDEDVIVAGNIGSVEAAPDLYATVDGKKSDDIEMQPILNGSAPQVESAAPDLWAELDPKSSALNDTESLPSIGSPKFNIAVALPGEPNFISYKTSLQDYCSKVGWMPPLYLTQQAKNGFISKVMLFLILT